jgi:hypothetical protein
LFELRSPRTIETAILDEIAYHGFNAINTVSTVPSEPGIRVEISTKYSRECCGVSEPGD